MYDGGKVEKANITEGYLYAESGSTLSGLNIEGNSYFELSTNVAIENSNFFGQQASIINKHAEGIVVDNSSFFTVYSSANKTSVKNGYLTIYNKGLAQNTSITGGYTLIRNGGKIDNTFMNGGELYLYSGGTANNTTINKGYMEVAGIANDTILNGENYDSGITVIDGGIINRASINGGTLVVGYQGSANDVVVNENGGLEITEGNAENITVNDDGYMGVYDGAADKITINTGGTLETENAHLQNLLAQGGAILMLDENTVLSGDISIDKDTDISLSSFDFTDLFNRMATEVKSLTLTGGVNDGFNNTVVNDDLTQDKSLTLADGEYSIAQVVQNGTTFVEGWDIINITGSENSPATIVKLESDIELIGNNQNLTIDTNSVLDVSGHSPATITLTGNVLNSGMIDFTIKDENNEPDDEFTVTGNYIASGDAKIALNIDPIAGKSDKLVINGDVQGTTGVYLKTTSGGKSANEIAFVTATNDDVSTDADFYIWRVSGSSYAWDTSHHDNQWFTYSTHLSKPEIVAEVAAYAGLRDTAIYQTSSLISELRNNITKNNIEKRLCYKLESWYPKEHCSSNINDKQNAWINPIYAKAEVDAPVAYEAEVKGLDAGIDLGATTNHKFGIMASIRNGEYVFDNGTDDYNINGSAEINLDSYLTGIYYRYDYNNVSTIASIYGGILNADVTTVDGVNADVDGATIGASLDIGYIYETVKDITLEPSLRINYQVVKFDDIRDNAGKDVDVDKAGRLEVEASMKIAKTLVLDKNKKANIFVTPSIIQSLNSNKDIEFNDGLVIEGTKDRTLGKIEIGGEYDINDKWSVSAQAGHTFGDDYKDTSANFNLRYWLN